MPTSLRVTPIDADENAVRNSTVGHMYVSQSYDLFIPAVRTPIPNYSGGLQLQNIPCGSFVITNASGNGLMFVGGIDDHAPFSGRGLSVYGGQTITLPMKNTNLISVMSQNSGEFIEYGAFLAGSNVSVDVSGIFINRDPIPPTLVSVTPTSGASGISKMAVISATFSEAIASGTINIGSFIVRESGTVTSLSGSVGLDASQTVGTFTPNAGIIQLSKTYQATVGQAITDLANNPLTASGIWSWQTQSNPTLVTVQPTSGTSGVATNADITATFNQPMASGTITTSAFTVRLSGIATNLSGVTFLNSSDTTQAVFIPYSGIITTSQVYVARLATSITDVDGNPLLVSGVWNWTTAAAPPPPDTTPPQVSGTTPVSGAIDVSGANDVLVSLSEQCQSGTVNTTNLFVRLSGQSAEAATVTLAGDLKSATINPTNVLKPGKQYHINVLSGVKDLAGNFLSPYVSGRPFNIKDLTYTITPSSGGTNVSIGQTAYVVFSDNMSSGSITTSTMGIRISGTAVPATVQLSGNLRAVSINPNSDLEYGKIYYIVMTSGVIDTNGNNFVGFSGNPFTTESPTYNTVYNVSDVTTYVYLDDNTFRVGERVQGGSPLIGERVTKVKFYLADDGNVAASDASGMLAKGYWDDGTNDTFGNLNPASVYSAGKDGNGFAAFTFENLNITHTLVQNDRIVIQYLSGDPGTARIKVSRPTSNAFIGAVNTNYGDSSYSGSSWTDSSSSYDIAGTFYSI